MHASAHFCNGLFCNLAWPETLSSDNLMWPDLFLAQGVSISAQPKKALVWVGCIHFAGLVGVRLGAYTVAITPCTNKRSGHARLAMRDVFSKNIYIGCL